MHQSFVRRQILGVPTWILCIIYLAHLSWCQNEAMYLWIVTECYCLWIAAQTIALEIASFREPNLFCDRLYVKKMLYLL